MINQYILNITTIVFIIIFTIWLIGLTIYIATKKEEKKELVYLPQYMEEIKQSSTEYTDIYTYYTNENDSFNGTGKYIITLKNNTGIDFEVYDSNNTKIGQKYNVVTKNFNTIEVDFETGTDTDTIKLMYKTNNNNIIITKIEIILDQKSIFQS